MSIGKGMTPSKSGKQNLNVKSSTEDEVVGASDRLTATLWMK